MTDFYNHTLIYLETLCSLKERLDKEEIFQSKYCQNKNNQNNNNQLWS